MIDSRIYLDHAATTPLAEAVSQAMAPWLTQDFGNPSSTHLEGRKARAAIDSAREAVATSLGVLFGEVIFTSGGTEAANLAILGSAMAGLGGERNKILIGAAEHHCVLHLIKPLAKLGYEIALIPCDSRSRIQPSALVECIDEATLLVSVMHANNETGVVNPISELSVIAHRHGALFHTDAVQTYLTLPTDLDALGADMVSVSAHKVNGPKGIGALAFRSGIKLDPILFGGGQEREMRGGTENVAGIIGFGTAVGLNREPSLRKAARNQFVAVLEKMQVPLGLTVGVGDDVLPSHAHFVLQKSSAEVALIKLDRAGVSCSSGAACSSGSLEPSHVLLAVGFDEARANRGLRFTFGDSTTLEEATEAARRISRVLDPSQWGADE